MTHDNDNDNIDFDFQLAPPDKLYAHNRRQLSAMLDGELSPDQARFMLRRLRHDGDLAACWERWQVCGDVLRGRGHALLPADFSQRVAAGIAAPASTSAAISAVAPPASGRGRQHRLLRWGGGALAASVALVALFMARQMPDPQAPDLAEAASATRSAPFLVPAAPPPTLVDAGDGAPATSMPGPAQEAAPDAAGLLAAAAPVAVAVAEVPRRTAGRNSAQSRRAAARRSQAAADVQWRAVAAAPPAAAAAGTQASMPIAARGLPAVAGLPPAAGSGDALFGALPAAAPRPWPRAVLPGLSGGRSLAAGFGLPESAPFAPFQPRLDGHAAVPTAPAPQAIPPMEEDADASVPGLQASPVPSE